MSKVKIEGNASGTGTLTISAPNTNTDRSLTLPDTAGEVLVTDGTITIDDTNDRVGIGTNSPSATLDVTTTIRSNASAATNDATVGKYSFYNTNASASSNPERAYIEAGRQNSAWGAYLKFGTSTGTNATTEAMRITENGGISGGSTTNSSRGAIVWSAYGHESLDIRRYADAGTVAIFRDDTTVSGTISVSGSSCSYNTSSDYRLKENVVDMTGAIDRVKALQPKRFNWIADEDDTTVDGFLAHEVSDVIPEAITGEKDATETYTDDDGVEQTRDVYQGIDQSKLVPLLTGALQEAIAKIEALETRIEALENV